MAQQCVLFHTLGLKACRGSSCRAGLCHFCSGATAGACEERIASGARSRTGVCGMASGLTGKQGYQSGMAWNLTPHQVCK